MMDSCITLSNILFHILHCSSSQKYGLTLHITTNIQRLNKGPMPSLAGDRMLRHILLDRCSDDDP